MVDGEHTRLAAEDAGVMVSVAVRTTPPRPAVMVALPVALAPAEALKFADDAPADMAIELGTITCALLLLRDTLTPP